MVYRKFQDIELSGLGMGCMRLPTVDGKIDKAQTFAMVDEAMAAGVNYYDTAWGYHGGESETVMGEALKRYPREKFYLATKFPGYDVSNFPKVKEIFEKQLEKLQVDYFDFYLFHNVCEVNIEQYLDPKYGVYDYLMEQKRNGRIKHLGFSVHGTLETMNRFLDAYGKDIEFCQIQLNYLDWSFQDAKGKVDTLNRWNIPVWVMEPLRGGKLAALDEQYAARLSALRPEETIPGWAFRFLQTVPGVGMVLSGMSDMEQMKQNIATFAAEKPLSDSEMTELLSIADEMTAKTSLPCTGCRYCVDHCPQGLDIPRIVELYNEHVFTGGGFIPMMAIGVMPEEKKPSACIGCRSCEQVCPQTIKISEMMSDFTARLKRQGRIEMAIGDNIKKLGFGLMRLPMKDEQIDLELVKAMADEFIGHGFSYFDTSPVYGMGRSEATFKAAVSDRYPHEKYHIATKLPMWTLNSPEEVEPKFEASLKALGVDYIDFYLIHGLSTVVSDRFPNSYLSKADDFGVWDFLKKVKADGRAKHIGFSYHSSSADLDAILTAHPEVEFVQLQINYIDWEDEVIQARRCYEVCRKHGVGVTVMEPCKGGTLVNVRSDVRAIMEEAAPNASLASWAIRYAASNEGIITVLSGMGNMDMMLDNVSYMDDFKPLTDGEREVLARVVDKLADVPTIKCTGCRYCVEGCPMSIKIPDYFAMYNDEVIYEGKSDGRRRFANHSSRNPKPSDCIQCGQCEAACPQHLPVIEHLKQVSATFEG